MLPPETPPALLLVDDTPSIRQLLTHLLDTVTPWEVIAVTDAAAALEVLARRPVPLMIADYHLPDMNGDALAARIKSSSPNTKIIIITADITFDGTNPWPDVDVWLLKPFPLHDLVNVIGTLLPDSVGARMVGTQKPTTR